MTKLPKTSFTYDNEQLAQLGRRIKKFIRKNYGGLLYSPNNPYLTSEFQKWLSKREFRMLLELGLIESTENNYTWKFFPIYGENLLLFCDFPSYSSNKLYVWLSNTVSRRSWKFFHTIPIRKEDYVLDLGTGSGLLALQARQKGCTSIGVDINPRAIQLAELNRDLNGLDSVKFRTCDWKYVDKTGFNVIVSQPPFGISLKGTSPPYSFDGGGQFGLKATKYIIKRFLPEKDQILALYVHSLEYKDRSNLINLLIEWIDNPSVLVEINPQGCLSLDLWWEKVKKRRNLSKDQPIPSDFLEYKEVVFYFIYLTRKD
ncbi:MAG: methyltransferase domain-containing protein [Candidatus Hermodarchaeota archaeon]